MLNEAILVTSNYHMDTHALTELLQQLPGVGRKQAERFAVYLVKRGPQFAQSIMQELHVLHTTTKVCSESYALFQSIDPTVTTSPIERDPSRDTRTLMIIEKDLDIPPMESAGYRGKYFVLGGLIPLVPKRSSNLRTSELLARIQRDVANGSLDEIIFGLSWNTESEHTMDELELLLQPHLPSTVVITRLGRGLSTGSELEYADYRTLQYALKKRL
jgi:recombination protein RecR